MTSEQRSFDNGVRLWRAGVQAIARETGRLDATEQWERAEERLTSRPLAWVLLEERSDHEYERVSLESFRDV